MAAQVTGAEGRGMSTAEPGSASDPRGFIEAPVLGALNAIVIRAVIGFSLVAAGASFPLLLHLDPPIHQAFHFLVPAGWVVYAALVGALFLLRRPPPEPDVWARAAEVDAALTRFAQRVSAVMLAGWLLAFAAVLVHHHLTSPREVFVTLGIIVPLTFAAWLLAALAWTGSCRAMLARAEHEANGRLRRYWSHLPQTRSGAD
jgi:hypothetical protein